MVPGFHNVAQFVKYDLLEDGEAGFMIGIETPSKDATSWRNTQVPPLHKNCTRAEGIFISVLLKPTGGKSHQIKIKASMDLKIPRWVLSGKVSKWVTNQVAKAVYTQIMFILSDFESSDFAKRAARDRKYFDKIRARLHESRKSVRKMTIDTSVGGSASASARSPSVGRKTAEAGTSLRTSLAQSLGQSPKKNTDVSASVTPAQSPIGKNQSPIKKSEVTRSA
jgi:hypothetical protein